MSTSNNTYYHKYNILPLHSIIYHCGGIAVKLPKNRMMYPIDGGLIINMENPHDMEEFDNLKNMTTKQKHQIIKELMVGGYDSFTYDKLPAYNKKLPIHLTVVRTQIDRKYEYDLKLAVVDEHLHWYLISPSYQYPLEHKIRDFQTIVGWFKLSYRENSKNKYIYYMP
jgi:hypothetical protein